MYYNQYHHEYKGASYISDFDGIKYSFVAKFPTNKIQTKWKYKYIAVPTVKELKKEDKKDRTIKKRNEMLTHRWWSVETDTIIKTINKQFGGKIEGRSKTTQSIYSYLAKKEMKLRVAKHSIFTRRSEVDISVIINERNYLINDNEYNIPSTWDDKKIENSIIKRAISFIKLY